MNEANKPKPRVRIYTRKDCEYSKYATAFLCERKIHFREVSVNLHNADGSLSDECDYVLRGWLAWASGQRALPQIFIDGEPIGGFADLMRLDATGDLRRVLDAAPKFAEVEG